MKRKLMAVLLGMAVTMSLVACGSSSKTEETPASSKPEASTEAPAEASEPVADNNGDGEVVIALMMKSMASEWNQSIEENLLKLGEEKGYTLLTFDADGDSAKQLDQLNDAINQGVDAIFMHIADEGIAEAAAEAVAAAGIPMVGESLPVKDGDGNWLCPCAVLNAAGCGTVAADWVVDNWESTGVDLSDPTKVGVALVTNTLTENAVLRHEGAKAELQAKMPEIPEENYFIVDISAGSNDYVEGGYNETSAVLTAHQDMKAWVVIGVQDDYALGACRAIEENGNVDNTILVSLGGEQAIPEWDGGTTKPWFATVYYTSMDFVEPCVDGLLSVVNDGAKLEDVFSDNIAEGQTYGTKLISGQAITYENYKEHTN